MSEKNKKKKTVDTVKSGTENKVPQDNAVKNYKKQNDDILASLRSEDIKSDIVPEKRSAVPDIIRHVLAAVCVVVILVSVGNIFYSLIGKKKADEYYKNIREMFYSESPLIDDASYLAKDDVNTPEEPLFGDNGDIYVAPEVTVEDMHTKYAKMLPNLEALRRINSYAFAWIKVAGTRVDYPIVKAPYGDNDFYLFHGLNRTYSQSGSIFMDFENDMVLANNRNTCIYGHNMNDGTMFQTIMNFKSLAEFANSTIEIYTREGIYVYTPFAAYDAADTDSFFHTRFENDAEFSAFLAEINEKSMFHTGVTAGIGDKIVTLITCTNTIDNKRFVVHGKLTGKIM